MWSRRSRLLRLFRMVRSVSRKDCDFSRVNAGYTVLPSFNPAGLLNVVFLDNVTNTNVTVTPGLNMTRERKCPIYLRQGTVADRACM